METPTPMQSHGRSHAKPGSIAVKVTHRGEPVRLLVPGSDAELYVAAYLVCLVHDSIQVSHIGTGMGEPLLLIKVGVGASPII